MDALGSLEEIAEQTSFRVNEAKHPRRRGKFRWGLSPNIARASVARSMKTKKKTKNVPRPKTLEVSPPKESPPPRVKFGRPFSDYRTLIESCRVRAEELELSRAELDRLAGLPTGYSGKLLGKVENSEKPKNKKRVWPIGLEAMLGALGLKIVVIEDEAAAARTLALRTPVDQAQQRFGNVSRIAAKLLQPPSQPTSSLLLTVVPAKRSTRGSKYG
jgi:hypothetical protein